MKELFFAAIPWLCGAVAADVAPGGMIVLWFLPYVLGIALIAVAAALLIRTIGKKKRRDREKEKGEDRDET